VIHLWIDQAHEFVPEGGAAYNNIWHHCIEDTLTNNAELGAIFALRRVENEYETSDIDNDWFSSMYVGMFDDPDGNPDAEYYLIVNMRNNEYDNGNDIASDAVFSDDPDMDQPKLVFLQSNPATHDYDLVWRSDNEDNFPAVSDIVGNPAQGDPGYVKLTCNIYPGQAILLKRTPKPTMVELSNGILDFDLDGPKIVDTDGVPGEIFISGTVELTGKIEFKGDVFVGTGDLLQIGNQFPTAILFDDGYGIHVNGSGVLDIEGTEDDPVYFGASDGDSRMEWSGITTTSSGNLSLNRVLIQNAEVGVKAGNTAAFVDKVEIKDCIRGIVLTSSLGAYLSNCHIHDCDYGIDAFSEVQTAGVDYTITSCTIENISNSAIHALGVDVLEIQDCLIQRIGRAGIKAVSVGSLRLDDLSNSGANNVIRYCAQDATLQVPYAAVTLESSSILTFEDMEIYENGGPGLSLNSSSALPGISVTNNLIANNALNGREVSTSSGKLSNSEIRVMSSGALNLDNTNMDIVDSWNDGDDDEHSLFAWYGGGTFTLSTEEVYWATGRVRGLVPLLSEQQLRNHTHVGPNPGTLNINIGSGLATTPHSSTDRYWAFIQDADPTPEDLFRLAHSLMDSSDYSEARTIFQQLCNDGYSSALSGLARSERHLGLSVAEIEDELLGIQPLESEEGFEFRRDLVIGNVRRLSGDFDGARSWFTDLAESSGNLVDSVNALMDVEYTNLLELNLLESEEDTTNIAAWRDIAYEIGEVRSRIDTLERTLYGDDASSVRLTSIPSYFRLHNAYPNPFNPSVTIPFDLPEVSDTKIAIYNVLGQRVSTVVDQSMQAGHHSIVWNGVSASGQPVSSGVYFVQMEAPGFIKTQKIVMLK